MNENDLKLDEQIRRAKAAKEIVEHPLFVEAVTILRADVFQRFTKTEQGRKGIDDREELWREQQTIEHLLKRFETVITTGRLAEETMMQRAKRVLRRA